MKTSLLQNIFRIILGLFMTLAGVGHLTFQRQEFVAQVPKWLSTNPQFTDFVVLSSGVVEIALGLLMIFSTKYRVKTGLLLALFLLLVFPGNISQYISGADAFGLNTDTKRFVRLLFQPILILGALWSTGALKTLFKSNSTKK